MSMLTKAAPDFDRLRKRVAKSVAAKKREVRCGSSAEQGVIVVSESSIPSGISEGQRIDVRSVGWWPVDKFHAMLAECNQADAEMARVAVASAPLEGTIRVALVIDDRVRVTNETLG